MLKIVEFSTNQLIILFRETHSLECPKNTRNSWEDFKLKSSCTKLNAGKDGSNRKN